MINIKRSLLISGCVLTAVFCVCVKVPEHCGDGYELNPATEFCFGNKSYKKCGGGEYNPDAEFCSGDAVYRLCGGNEYSPSTEFCESGEVKSKPPELYTYSITATANPTAGGTVSRSPDQTSYASGTQVKVTATPASGYVFKNWTGALTSTDNPLTITADGDKALVAVFERQQQGGTYTLTTGVTPVNSGSVTRSPDKSGYASGESVTVTAKAEKCYAFSSWTGASLAPTNPLTIKMDGSKTLIASFNKVCEGGTPGEPLVYGGQTYRTVVIGGKTWMAENMNYDTANNVGSWCYDYSPDSCAKYGRLYNWNTAMSACPAGWRLPTLQDWGDLAIAAGGTGNYGTGGEAGRKLKTTSGWGDMGQYNGTDDFGFSALPGGSSYSYGGFSSNNIGNNGYWWTATEVLSGSTAYYLYMKYNGVGVYIDNSYQNNNGFSVRCVRNN